MSNDRLGVALIGMGGAVATTAIAGIELIKAGGKPAGLPLASHSVPNFAPYAGLTFGGWDLSNDDLATAAVRHGVIGEKDLANGAAALRAMHPRPAIGSVDFCANIDGAHKITARNHRAAIDTIQTDLAGFKSNNGLDRVVMINVASVERLADLTSPCFASLDNFERALDRSDAAISPAMLYAYAAIMSDTPYGNFTPSVAADAAPLALLARQRNVPIGGKDGKTGQTLLKTVIAPALKARALHVDGWFSTNILGNGDGKALDDPKSLASKIATKKTVLDELLGYPVHDHIVHIHYYRPRGDNKEAWDNIDIAGFMGQQMQIKVNFLCKDSVLAAPLVIEIARVLDLARKRGEGGVQKQLSVFFKAPQTINGELPVHSFAEQQSMLERWLVEEK